MDWPIVTLFDCFYVFLCMVHATDASKALMFENLQALLVVLGLCAHDDGSQDHCNGVEVASIGDDMWKSSSRVAKFGEEQRWWWLISEHGG